jgi:hypothetical protein
MPDPLDAVWGSMDTPRPLFTTEEIAAWPAGSFERLQQLNLLRPAENRAYITCPNCDERHESEVVLRREGDGRTRMFAICPEALRVELSAKEIHCWTLDFERFARCLNAALSLDGRCRALSAARAWHLGRTRWQDAIRDVVFVRGLGWPDQAVELAERAIASLSHPPAPDEPEKTPTAVGFQLTEILAALLRSQEKIEDEALKDCFVLVISRCRELIGKLIESHPELGDGVFRMYQDRFVTGAP